MGQVHITRTIPHPASSAWSWIRDYGNVHRIHPALGKSWVEGERECGLGAERVCEMKAGGFRLRERVTEWRENEHYTVDVYETSMPFVRSARATLGVRPKGTTSSVAYMHVEYETRYGWFGRAMDALVLRWMMIGMTRLVLRKLDRTLSEARSSPGHEALPAVVAGDGRR